MKTSGRRRGRKEGGRKRMNLQTEEKHVIAVQAEFVTPEGVEEMVPAVASEEEQVQEMQAEQGTPLLSKKGRKSLVSKWCTKWKTKWTVTSRQLKFRKTPPKTNLKQEKTRSSRYVCDTCKKKFTYQKNWMKHSCGTPIPPEELRCELCGTEFTQKNNKRRHMRSKHENPAHFSCEYCKKTYSRADNCKAHIKVCPLKLSDLE